MSEEHIGNLKKARAQLIEQRRAFVQVLAGPYDRGKTEQAREKFMEIQATIDAMDRAIEDEEESRRSRSEERRVGKECCTPCRSRWSPYH